LGKRCGSGKNEGSEKKKNVCSFWGKWTEITIKNFLGTSCQSGLLKKKGRDGYEKEKKTIKRKGSQRHLRWHERIRD